MKDARWTPEAVNKIRVTKATQMIAHDGKNIYSKGEVTKLYKRIAPNPITTDNIANIDNKYGKRIQLLE